MISVQKIKRCGVIYPLPASKEINGKGPVTHLFSTTMMINSASLRNAIKTFVQQRKM